MTREEKQKAVDALKISAPVSVVTQEEFNDYIQTLNHVMDWLEQEPCEDVVSRQAVLDQTYLWSKDEFLRVANPFEYLRKRINSLSSITPQPKTGRWIIIDDCEQFIAKCSECGRIEDSRMISEYLYCHCGAKMIEPQESEDKE